MEFTQFLFFFMLLGSGYAWPWHNSLTMERARINQWSGKIQGMATSLPNTCSQEEICKSVRIGRVGETADTAVHVCSSGNGVCYFSELPSCCSQLQNAVQICNSSIKLESRAVSVQYYTTGGFNSNSALGACFYVPDGSIGHCRTAAQCIEPECKPTTEVCEENAISCDANNGCVCKPGFLPSEEKSCCDCDISAITGPPRYKAGGECPLVCLKNCVNRRRDPNTGQCFECATGYQGPGCCDCAPGFITISDNCVEVCVDNVVPSFTEGCTESSCTCATGFKGPTCCECFFDSETTQSVYFMREGRCDKICTENADKNNCDGESGCTSCANNFVPPDCCECPSDRILDASGNCVCPPYATENADKSCSGCPPGKEVFQGACVCIPGTIDDGNDGCIAPCRDNCVPGQYGPRTGCNQCKPGYMAPHLCCDCTSDRIINGESCVCPSDKVKDVDGNCVSCPGLKIPGADGTCQCPEGTTEQGDTCIAPCIDNQDIFFILDPSASFNVLNLRRVVRVIQLIIRELNHTSEDFRVAVVRYPILLTAPALQPYNKPSDYLVKLDTTCEAASVKLNRFTFDFSTQVGRSDLTRSYDAMRLLADSGDIRSDKKTTIFTITDSNSEGYDLDSSSADYAPNKINAAITKARVSDLVRFFALGVITEKATKVEYFQKEIETLAENIPNHMETTNDFNTPNAIIDLLERNAILCTEQASKLRAAITEVKGGQTEVTRYGTCINKFAGRRGGREQADTCGSVCPLTAAESFSEVEKRILAAIEEAWIEKRLNN